ncbi:MAG: hypothetical protein HPY61_11130 [Methanotrichaceae archaeon]|nr:hypothetical protein [Methanotrichaceae archaeon]
MRRFAVTSAIAIVFLLTVIPTSGEVSISNAYYTVGAQVNEDTYLENVGYENLVDIFPADISLSGSAESFDEKNVKFQNSIDVLGPGTGAALSLESSSVEYKRSLYAGAGGNMIDLSYVAASGGTSKVSMYNSHTSAENLLETAGCEYSGSIIVQPTGISLVGSGSRLEACVDEGFLSQSLTLQHNGKKINTDLSLTETSLLGNPLVFDWSYRIDSLGSDWARSMVDFSLEHGERDADFEFVGTSYISPSYDEEIEPKSEGTDTSENWWIYYLIQ